MSLPHTPITRTPWHHHHHHPQPVSPSHDSHKASGLAGMPPDFPLPQPPTGAISLASPFHPGTTFRSSRARKSKEGDRFHDVRQLFARRELERQNSVAVHGRKRCFCEKELEDEEDIYCSSACARMDAMSSLCFAETRPLHTAESSISSLSSVSTSLTSSTIPRPTSDAQQIPLSPSQASHYRRITSDLVKRRAAHARTGTASSRRRQRDPTAQASFGSTASTSTSSIHRVPSLVGGQSMVMSTSTTTTTTTSTTSTTMHSRTASDESGRSSLRWPSVSDRGIVLAEVGQAGLGNVKEEKEDDVERLADAEEEEDQENVGVVPIHTHGTTSFRPRRGSLSFATLNHALSHPDTAFGMGKDMQDVLDEIIMMEQGFDIQTSESEHEDVAAQSRPVTPPVRESIGLPSAPRRSAHYLDDPGHAASMGPLRTSRHIASRSEPSLETCAPPVHIMSQLPSAFEDAEDDPTAAIYPQGPPYLVEGRRSFTRRSRSEIRRSLSFVPPTGYRASLLASLQGPAPRAGAHPYRRPAAATTMTTVDDSVTRFQFPKMPPPQTGSVIRTTIAESQEMEVVVSPPTTIDGAMSNDHPAGELAPALFPASPVEADPANPETAVPTSGLRLGVLLGSGVDEDEDAWFRSCRAGEKGAMDVETP